MISLYTLLSSRTYTDAVLHISFFSDNEEVAFCSLACQTRALLYVAEAQQKQQQQSQDNYSLTNNIASDSGTGRRLLEPTGLLPDKKSTTPFNNHKTQTPVSTLLSKPVPSQSPSHSAAIFDRDLRATGASSSSRGQRPLASNTSTNGATSSRPPLHSRYSVAIVNDLVESLANPVSPAQHHPIMTSLRSGIFSVSSPTPTPVTTTTTTTTSSESEHHYRSSNNNTSTRSILEHQNGREGCSTGTSPTRSNNIVATGVERGVRTGGAPTTPLLYYSSSLNPSHTGGTSTLARTSSTASSGAHTSGSLVRSTYMDGDNTVDPANSAEALYRQHYPKFANRRHLQDPSPNRSRMTNPNSMSSTMSDLPLLTPPSALRPLLYLPEPGETDGSSPTYFRTITNPFADTYTATKFEEDTEQFSERKFTKMNKPVPLSHAPTSSRTSPFNYIPERRSAPRRSLEISPSISQHGFDQSSENLSTEKDMMSVSDSASDSTTQTINMRSLDSRLPVQNSLGLEITHVERVDTPDQTSFTSMNGVNSPDVDENVAGLTVLNGTNPRAGKAARTNNPVSPPKCRSPLSSVYAASTTARLGDYAADEGWRSVEASRYTLGPREASYIVRKLAEEQRKRQLKEKAAGSKDDPIEDRGRSRTRKRAGSWGNALERGQSRPCKCRFISFRSYRARPDVFVAPYRTLMAVSAASRIPRPSQAQRPCARSLHLTHQGIFIFQMGQSFLEFQETV